MLVLLLLGLLLLGAVLLSLPIAQRGRHIGVLDCLFTATSAATLTGLVTVSTANSWSTFGQLVILVLVQLAGIIFISQATIVAMMLGLHAGLHRRLQVAESGGFISLAGMRRIFRAVTLLMLTTEALGALLLALRFHFGHLVSWSAAAFQGIFYAVSAFCNAGFTLAPGFQSLEAPALRADSWLLIIIGVLVIIGGLGFGVVTELLQFPRTRRMSLQAKLVLGMTLTLIVLGMALIILFEGWNPLTLGAQHGVWPRLLTSWFMAVSPRSAGFHTFNLTLVSPPTLFVLGLLMIIGASPESAGGGVKTTTLAIVFFAIFALLRRKQDIELGRRRISGEMVRLALSLLSLYLFVMLLLMIGVTLTEVTLRSTATGMTAMLPARFNLVMFEVVAALGNVGMNTGISASFAPATRVLLMLAMLIGRLGPLAFVFVFARPRRPQLRHLPAETIMAG